MEHLININFAPGGLPDTVHVTQLDNTTRVLKFVCWFGRSKVDVPANASVRMHLLKSDGNTVVKAGTVNSEDSAIVEIETTSQMTAAPGPAKGIIVISGANNERIGSASFVMIVHKDPLESGTASESDISFLQEAINQTAANATAAATSETNAASSATAAAGSATAAASSATAAGTSETNAASSATAAAGSATAAASSAAAAASSAELAQQAAENAGYAFFDVNTSDGLMYVTVTDSLDSEVTFEVDENNGTLEVAINE